MTAIELTKERNELAESAAGATRLFEYLMFSSANPKADGDELERGTGMSKQEATALMEKPYLSEYLNRVGSPYLTAAQLVALQALPSVVEAMALVATGKLRLTGMNPQAAAEFVLKVAQSASENDEARRSSAQVNVFIPQVFNNVLPDTSVSPYPVVDAQFQSGDSSEPENGVSSASGIPDDSPPSP